MKTVKGFMTMPHRMMQMSIRERIGKNLRRSMNALAHVLTPHGKLMSGRKGRKG